VCVCVVGGGCHGIKCGYAERETLKGRKGESGERYLGRGLRGLEERCKLPQQSRGQSPAKFWIWSILGLENCIKQCNVAMKRYASAYLVASPMECNLQHVSVVFLVPSLSSLYKSLEKWLWSFYLFTSWIEEEEDIYLAQTMTTIAQQNNNTDRPTDKLNILVII